MQKLNYLLLFLCTTLFVACGTKTEIADYRVIPLPQEVELAEDNPFVIQSGTLILYPESNELLKRNAGFLADYLEELTGRKLKTAPLTEGYNENAIVLGIDNSIGNPEGYRLQVTEKQVNIAGKNESGVFYGIQTLRKSVPIVDKATKIVLPAVEVNDYPRFGYRGIHLDVARHFFSAEFVKKFIDLLALHNINNFHWHLTDDQGWRIEIKKYPKLTEVGSIRAKTVIGRNTTEYDETPYGGFYTQEEIKDIVAYAAERFINVIPEVDLPGHMLAALASYPEFGCTGGPYEVEPTWGIFPDVLCIGNEDAMLFLEDVFAEVIELFPSKYIHIGGDEAPRDRWKVCPKCQARIKKEGLKTDAHHTAEDRLQTYCMTRMEKFLNERGRQIIGWDEILDGDVAPNATIMSWRGMDGGIKAAQLKHDVVMSPTTYAYLNYYPTDKTENEPLGIGGYLPLEKVYSLEPVPAELSDEEKKHILGAQANLWTEYIGEDWLVEYMVLPRMAALSEVQWTMPEKKDYQDFTSRLPHLMKIYDAESYKYGTHAFDIQAKFIPMPEEKKVEIVLSTIDNAPIYYTLDGSEPTKSSLRYEDTLVIYKTAKFRAVAIRPTSGSGRIVSEEINFNKATTRPITLKLQPSATYAFDGPITLVDGLKGNDNYATGRWLGFIGGDMEAVIDLEESTEINKVSTQAVVDMSAWIMGSTGLVVSVSDDNQEFREIASRDYPLETDIGKHCVETYEVAFEPITTRYVKVLVKRTKALPPGHNGEGTTPYMFIDEISIE